ncbi:MAG: DUF4304 domain-containing protein [Massilia sp.]
MTLRAAGNIKADMRDECFSSQQGNLAHCDRQYALLWEENMAHRHDYGNFSRAAPRLLKPLVEKLNFKQIKGGTFGREREDWVEGFSLQQSAHGSGDFCVNIGIHVPKLADLWKTEPADRSFGLTIWSRLGPHGVDDETWYPAGDSAELKSSSEQVAAHLHKAEIWLSKYRSMSDIADEYKSRNNLGETGESEHVSSIAIINYGFLLVLAGQKTDAKYWLEKAFGYWQKVVADNEEKVQRRRPGKETLGFYAEDMRRLDSVKSALAEWF